jgi:hypothetical protein
VNYPEGIEYIEFIPRTTQAKNISAQGQTSSIPLFNFTPKNYGRIANLSILMNGSISCINVSISNNATTNKVRLFNYTWVDLFGNVTYLQPKSLWMYADYNCTSSSWQLWNPEFSLRACCSGCDICSTELV